MTRLRFALLFDGTRLEQWRLRCLEELEPHAELARVVVAPRTPAVDSAGSRLLDAYARRLEQGSLVELGEQFAAGPAPGVAGGDDAIDFVLGLGQVTVPPGLAEATRLGVWRFEHEVRAQRLPFFAEVYAGEDVTRAALVAVDGPQGTLTIEEGVFRTDKRSYGASRARIVNAIAVWPARACRRLSHGSVQLQQRTMTAGTKRRCGLARFAGKLAARRLGLAWERLFRHPQWNVGVLHRPIEALLEPGAYNDADVDWFPLDGKEGFLADPFAVLRDGHLQILCEYFDYRESRGRICALEHSAHGFSSERRDALSPPVHTSYPFLLDLPDGIYCVPETANAGEIALYRATELLGEWVKVTVLVEGFPGVDPTVFRHDGHWWLLCTRKGAQEDSELWVWHAPEVTGPWESHPLNPVKTDVRGARPAGPPFVHDGVLYRPTQDCSATYGGRTTLQRVTHLTPTEFAEEPVTVLEASARSPFPRGPHTVTPIGDVVLVDGCRTTFVPAAFRAFLAIWARSLTRRMRRSS